MGSRVGSLGLGEDNLGGVSARVYAYFSVQCHFSRVISLCAKVAGQVATIGRVRIRSSTWAPGFFLPPSPGPKS